jgi:ATP-dependent Clp protease ATP-binding subunit ClpC
VGNLYTQKVRRAIFTARVEAFEFNSQYVESEHLLLGLLKNNQDLVNKFSDSGVTIEFVRGQLLRRSSFSRSHDEALHSLDLLLSDEVNRVLIFAGEEAERMGHRYIGTEHLLLGLLREEKCLAARFLKEAGISLEKVRSTMLGS